MANLNDVRKQHPVRDQAVYERAYAEADIAGRLAEVVYRLRTTARLTQTELARRMGTTQSAVARVEGGGSTPTLDLLDRVGRAVGVEIVLAIGGEALRFGASANDVDPSSVGQARPHARPSAVSVNAESHGDEEARAIPNLLKWAA